VKARQQFLAQGVIPLPTGKTDSIERFAWKCGKPLAVALAPEHEKLETASNLRHTHISLVQMVTG
jgi:hypothetical protein